MLREIRQFKFTKEKILEIPIILIDNKSKTQISSKCKDASEIQNLINWETTPLLKKRQKACFFLTMQTLMNEVVSLSQWIWTNDLLLLIKTANWYQKETQKSKNTWKHMLRIPLESFLTKAKRRWGLPSAISQNNVKSMEGNLWLGVEFILNDSIAFDAIITVQELSIYSMHAKSNFKCLKRNKKSIPIISSKSKLFINVFSVETT